MPIFDVSVPLSAATPTYPGDPRIEIKQWLTLAAGDPANVSLLHFGAHSGTHVDAPSHFIEGGSGVDSLPLDSLLGLAEVIDVPDQMTVIDEHFVDRYCNGAQERVLFKTRNSQFWDGNSEFRSDYTYLAPAAARRLVGMGLKLVGIDYLSIEQFQSQTFEAHLALLGAGVVVLEGLDLRQVPAGTYHLTCLPLRIAEGTQDGAPARTVLRTLD